MTRADRSGSHRGKKKRLTLILAPVAALAVAVPLMARAGAATPSEVAADCKSNSDKLQNCEFVDVQFKKNSFGPNQRVSRVEDNCGSGVELEKSFTISGEVNRIISMEDGTQIDGSFMLGGSALSVGAKFLGLEFNIKRDDKATGFSATRSGTALPGHTAYFMWSHKRLDVSGYLKATYKEPQNGQKVFFSPSEKSPSVHVFYPKLLKNGTPDGRLWLRNVKCGSGLQSEEGRGGGSRVEPEFNAGGPDVTDVEVPLSSIPELSGA